LGIFLDATEVEIVDRRIREAQVKLYAKLAPNSQSNYVTYFVVALSEFVF